MKKLEFSIRSSHEGDLDFIKSAWLHGMWKHHAYHKHHTPRFIFDADQTAKIHEYLTYGAKVKIAHEASNSNSPVGFICYTDVGDVLIVHFLFVKTKYQRMGVGLSLLNHINIYPEKEEVSVTEVTDPVKKISKAKQIKVTLVNSLYERLIALQNQKLLKE